MRRHHKHAAAVIAKAAERRGLLLGDNILARVEKLYKSAEKILDDALINNDGRLALAAIGLLGGIIRGMYSMTKDAAIARAASEPIRFRVMIGDEPAKPLPIPPVKHSIIS